LFLNIEEGILLVGLEHFENILKHFRKFCGRFVIIEPSAI